MKRLMAIVLVLAMFFLYGCNNQTANTQVPDTSAPTAQNNTATKPNEENIQSTQKPMYTISLPYQINSAKAEDGTVIFNCIYQNISLVHPEAEVADKIIVDFLNRTDKITQYAETALSNAKQAYTSQTQWTPHLLQMLYSPMRFDSNILSLYSSKVSYTGGAHAGYSGASVNYDLLTGDNLNLSDILRKNITADTLCSLVNTALSAVKNEYQLFSSYDITVKQLLGTTISDYQSWYFSQTGLCFFFDPYEIAPFSSGTVIAEIPYSQLTGILEDAYFPAEEDPAQGTLNAEPFTVESLKKFTQFSELILKENSSKILLSTDKSVYDIHITTKMPVSDGASQSPNITLFAAHTLTPGDAIMIDANFAETALEISCRTGERIQQYTVTVKDGNILLIPN